MQTKSATEVDSVIGHRIRTIRKAADLSQAEVGAMLGVSFQQVQKYENGSNRIAASRLYKLAGLMKRPITAFLPKAA